MSKGISETSFNKVIARKTFFTIDLFFQTMFDLLFFFVEDFPLFFKVGFLDLKVQFSPSCLPQLDL